MSTKKKKKRKRPMRLWLVRDIDDEHCSRLRLVRSPTIPWLYQNIACPGWWHPSFTESELIVRMQFDIKPGYCVELREVR